jgi:2'-hydroxyisoflavone reductase
LRYSRRVRLLVLGGSGFVGRAVVVDALGRGWDVTTFNRGRSEPAVPEVERLTGDRLRRADLSALAGRTWDLVVDTWAGAPRAVADSAGVLADHAGRYAYVSSESVYEHPPPLGADESARTVYASPEADEEDYAALKRGAELEAEAAFGDRALLARAATILGPHENIGRLPWWLLRMDRGGEVLAPGPPDRALQYVDARDLARWLLDAAVAGASGPFNVASRKGHATMASLLEACRDVAGPDAELTWVSPEHVAASEIEPWTQLPVWLPPDGEYGWLHDMSVERSHAMGLQCRPVEETVADTWEWLLSTGKRPPLAEHAAPGLDAAKERAALVAWQEQPSSNPQGV